MVDTKHQEVPTQALMPIARLKLKDVQLYQSDPYT